MPWQYTGQARKANMHCNQNIWSRGNYGIINDRFKMKGQEASSWLKMVTRKMKLEVLRDTVHKLSPPQARKNCFIWMGHLYGAFGPGTTCWPGGGSEMLSRGRGVKNGLQGGRLATCPPPRPPMPWVIIMTGSGIPSLVFH